MTVKMADLLETVRRIIWDERFWFPKHLSWDSLKNTNPNIYKAQTSDLVVPLYLCFVIVAVKIVFERCVGYVVKRLYNLKSVTRKAADNPVLEAAFGKSKVPTQEKIEGLSKQTDLKVRQVERWFRIRRNQDRTPVLRKFCESSWRFTYYAVMFFYGLWTLWDKPWLWTTTEFWKDWPEHHVSSEVYWYYAIHGGFYLAMFLSLFTDHKRKDLTEMTVHHLATLGLMFLSWMTNFIRIGSMILLVHDCVDPLLEAAKMAKYMEKDSLCTALFVTFMLTWVATRMTFYPFVILRSMLLESYAFLGEGMYYSCSTMLILLQILHIIWFYFILLIAKQALFEGGIKKDSRSSDETISEEEMCATVTPQKLKEKNKEMQHNEFSAHNNSPKNN